MQVEDELESVTDVLNDAAPVQPSNLDAVSAGLMRDFNISLPAAAKKAAIEAIKERHFAQMERDERIWDEDLSMYERIMIHMRRRMLFADDLAPVGVLSIAAHAGDLHQGEPEIQGHGVPFNRFRGNILGVGLPVCIVSPAGYSKSWLMSQMFKKRTGICPYPSKFSAVVTEAGFVGSMVEGAFEPGDAAKFANGFLVFNEMQTLFEMAKTTHSGSLINQVLEALSERRLTKRTSNLDLTYPTRVTIVGGVQPARMSTSSGLGRRFIFNARLWTPEDLQVFMIERMQERVHGGGGMVNQDEVDYIREFFKRLRADIAVEDTWWDERMYQFMVGHTRNHLELENLEKLLIARALFDQYENAVVRVTYCDENKKIALAYETQMEIVKSGTDIGLLLGMLGNNEMTFHTLFEIFQSLGYQLDDFKCMLDRALKNGFVQSCANVRGEMAYCSRRRMQQRTAEGIAETLAGDIGKVPPLPNMAKNVNQVLSEL